jgi:ribosomal protein L37AE/L43A
MDPTTVAIILGGVIAVLGGALLWARLRAGAGEALLHFRCPQCKTRIRYAVKRVGSKGWCPKCGKSFVFPSGNPGAGERPRA